MNRGRPETRAAFSLTFPMGYNKIRSGKEVYSVTVLDQVYEKMVNWYAGDPAQIQHFVKVHSFAALIGRQEGLTGDALLTLEIAALVHDIGIRPAMEKYGSSAGPLQELEGPGPAFEMLFDLELPEALVQRVCYLVSRHHTYTNVDGLDYRILLEADFLVNCFEGSFGKEAAAAAIGKVFFTETGIRLHKTMFGLE